MLVKALDISKAGERATLTPLKVDFLPRIGEVIRISEKVAWRVKGVEWSGHPDTLEPTLMLEAEVTEGEGLLEVWE